MLTSMVAADPDMGGERSLYTPPSRQTSRMLAWSKPALVILALSLLVPGKLLYPVTLQDQASKGLSQQDIVSLLGAEVASERIVALVQEREVSFELTPQAEQALRRAGASSELIEAVRAHYKPPTPSGLIIQSRPGGASVFIDSQVQVKTSSGGWANIQPIAPGPHVLRISAEGFDDFTRDILLQPGETLTVNATLVRSKAAPAVLVVASTPPGAAVFVDGRAVGNTDGAGQIKISDLQPGKHSVRVSAEGYVDFEQAVQLASGKEATVSAGLERAKPVAAGLILSSLPRGAAVFVDEVLVEKNSPGGDLNVPELAKGKHTVRVTAEGYAPFEQPIDLGPGTVLTLHVLLAPLVPTAGAARDNIPDGLRYVWIPPGTFMMGCSAGETQQCLGDERPPHRVTISRAFWLGQTEVTVGAYKRFVAAKGAPMPNEPVFGTTPLNPGWGNDLMPIVNVTRADAEAYCGWAGGRLPTEAEWEYAARGGSAEGRYGPVDEIAWYADNSGRARLDSELIWKQEQSKFSDRLNENGNTFHAIMQKKPNAYNLYDILGNVWEWVSDRYEEKYYSKSPELDPRGPASGEFGIFRGGSWYTGPRVSRAAPRFKTLPDSRGFATGIRCARDTAP